MPPGHSALALLVSHVFMGDLQRELQRFPGSTLVESTFSEGAIRAVREAMGEDETAVDASVPEPGTT